VRPARPTPGSPRARATAFGVFEDAAGRAEPALREVANDRRLRTGLASGSGADARLEQLAAGPSEIVLIELYIENASLHETVERQAVTDELTGLANARAFRTILAREIERSRRFQTPLGLVMVDLDDFKQVNDRHGHQQEDEVLASMAGILRDFSRDIDAPPVTGRGARGGAAPDRPRRRSAARRADAGGGGTATPPAWGAEGRCG
jgi:GGDEF domain-containing protein